MVVMAIAELVLLGLVNGFGSDATAAYGAVNQVMGYVQFTALSIAITVSIFGAQAIGGGQAGRLDAIVGTGLLVNLVLTGGLVALIYLFPRTVLGVFITDRAVLDLAKGCSHRAVEYGAVRHGDGIFRCDARGRHGVGADAAVDLRDCRDRNTIRRDPEPDDRHRRRLGGISDRVLRHVRAADGLLHAGLAPPPASAPDLTRGRGASTIL